jgi:hypothetical protein
VTIAAVEMGVERPLMADCVAKLFLQDGTQIFRAVGATIEQ